MGRPNQARITREGATRAALAIIDGEGLEALSLELVARSLGVKAPSLYHHFRDKAELLAEVARFILLDLGLGDQTTDLPWDEAMVRVCVATRRTLLKHHNAAPLLLQFFPRHIMLRGYDRWVATCPFPPETHMTLLEGAEKLTYASALFEAAALSRGVAVMPAPDAARLPHLARAIEANPHDGDALFEASIRTYLAGFTAREHATKAGGDDS